MRFLFYKWNALMQDDCITNLKRMGHEVDFIIYVFHNHYEDPFFERKFLQKICSRKYDAVISFNYFPLLSILCNRNDIPYFSWIYDSPSPNLAHMDNPCNHMCFFDRSEYIRLAQTGHTTVYHLPLAVDTHRLDSLQPTKKQIEQYSAEISFVGKLYQDMPGKDYEQTKKNRFEALSALSRNHEVKLYASYASDMTGLSKVKLCGPVTYYQQMPLVFRLSKININITLTSIHSGIPLRILDILGAGGFLLTNHQSELDDYFIDGKDIVIYENIDELCEKADYYLTHEEDRRRIASSGHQKAKELFNYPRQLQKMFALGGLCPD